MGAGVRQGLNWDGLKLLKFTLPPVDEQIEITGYLDNKCAEIDTLIEKKTALLAEMEAYKKSVIYEYVTGKKEVQVVKDTNAPRNGFIITDETEVAFFSNGYVFTFFDKEFTYDYMKELKPNADGFVNGRTTKGLPISLYTGENGIWLYGSTSVNISAYAVGI